jgi:hypothetical protein
MREMKKTKKKTKTKMKKLIEVIGRGEILQLFLIESEIEMKVRIHERKEAIVRWRQR